MSSENLARGSCKIKESSHSDVGLLLKGVLHLLPQNYHVLWSMSKRSTSFLKNNICIYSKLSKKLKNSIKIKVGQAVLELLIQTTF